MELGVIVYKNQLQYNKSSMNYKINNTHKIVIILIILTGLFLRFFLISKIPLALYHDEMDHVFTGEAIARFGTDITSNWQFWRLEPLQTYNVTAELSGFFHAIGQTIFGLGPTHSHLTNAFFGLMTCILFYFFTKRITQNRQIAFWSFLFLLINPWNVYISRMNYEIVISLFFQLLTIFFIYIIFYENILHKNELKKNLFYFLMLSVSYFFSFFTYHGTKIFLPAITLTLLLGAYFLNKNYKNKIFYLFSFLTLILISINFFPVWRNYQNNLLGNRETNDLIISSKNREMIFKEYRAENLHFPLQKIFINQHTALLNEITKRYIFTWDIFRLFSGQESGYQFSLSVHSFFYLSSFLFSVFGFIFLFKLSKKQKLFFLIILFVSPITNALSGWQSIFRSAFFYLTLVFIFALGFHFLLSLINANQKFMKNSLIFATLIFIFIESINFGYHYFVRYPIITADNHYFSQRLLAGYLGHKPNEKTYVIVEDLPCSYARSYIFYQQIMPKLTSAEKQQFSNPQSNIFEVNNVIFTNSCPKLTDKKNVIISGVKFENCQYNLKVSQNQLATPNQTNEIKINDHPSLMNTISSPRDSGAYFYLLKGDLCQEITTNNFIHQIDINNYQPENLSLNDFCQNWVKSEPHKYKN
jgi:hypothetical protein